MSAQRIGETLQPAWDRTTGVIAVKLQPALVWTAALTRNAAALAAFVLRPTALAALACGVWRLGIDLGWTQDFFISQGLFSHWQVWFVLALGMISGAGFLGRHSSELEDNEED